MTAIDGGLFGVLLALLALHLVSVLLAYIKQNTPPKSVITDQPMVSVLRPICGLENNLAETLTTTFAADYPNYEIIFCVTNPRDPVIALANQLIAAHPHVRARLLIGDDRISGNPKLNNLAKGWRAAQADWIVMVDSNVLLPPDYIQRLLAEWRHDTGLVTSPPAGVRPEGFAAQLECGFLNALQARFQLASAAVGHGFAQGKILFWRRSVLEDAGGIAMLGQEMAEDVAATKLVRAQGLKVRLTQRLFAQPIGQRSFAAVWQRQLRWAKVRRLGFLPLFLPEIFIGGAVPLLLGLLLVINGAIPLAQVILIGFLWYAAEFLLAYASGWPRRGRDVLAWLCRDALLPGLWIAAWFGNGFEWRGTAMTATDATEMPLIGEPRFADT
jgi:ceramide glucosyltransferase